uniref:Uncharacterized protein n=1 Tax=viral metagenome TaxID=1070528 RepID=A0A6C0FBA9_9ZZZZ|tara:strand:+ start:7637 stop:8308 length:672 start_codon:yes stop_codon:yes gene_type:complete
MERPESSNQEYFTNEDFEIKEDNDIILLEENHNFDTFTNEITPTPVPVVETSPDVETPPAKKTTEEVKAEDDAAFDDLATTIWKATVDNAIRVQSYVTRIHGGILKPIRWGVNVDDELVARIFIGAAVIGAFKRIKFYNNNSKFSWPYALLSLIRIVVAIFYPFVYLTIIFCEEMFWKTQKVLDPPPMQAGISPMRQYLASTPQQYGAPRPQTGFTSTTTPYM